METQTLDIPVLWPNYFTDCDFCIRRLKEALQGMDGMQSVEIDERRGTIKVVYDKDLLTFEDIREQARLVGVSVEQKFKHDVIRISGLDCPDCAGKLEKSMERMPGVAWASVSYASAILIVEYEQEKVSRSAIEKRIREFGYDIVPEEPLQETWATRARRSLRLALTALSGVFLAVGIVMTLTLGTGPATTILFILSAIAGGIFIARSGILSLRGLSLDTNFLVTIAAVGAIALGDFSEAAAVIFLFALGSTLEAYTVEKTRRSIRSLIESVPSHAQAIRNGHVVRIPVEEIQIGDIIIVKPGEKLPTDGTVISGTSAVNEAPVTGESTPRDKTPGDQVFAGSVNGAGALEIRATATSEDNTLARVVHMVEEAQAQKAPSHRFSEAFGRYYTPIVIGLAVLIAAIGPLLSPLPFTDWVERSLTLLVVSCPCALVISTPVAVVAAIGNAAKSGVLIKGGAHLETLGAVTVVAFDKTGTLTTGKLSVTDVLPLNSHTRDEVLEIAAATEERSEHPLADAIVQKAREEKIRERAVSFFEALPGKGARAVIDGELFYVGSRRLMEDIGIDIPGSTAIANILTSEVTVVYVASETELLGAIAAKDTLKRNSKKAIEDLKALGIRETVMLTGDTAQTGRAIARELAIDTEYSELLPQDKLNKIRDLARQHRAVAMVGDGINDAPALAAANVGIAMGGAGTHAAIEASDVTLMADDILMLPYAMSLSRKSLRIIKQNVAIALVVVAFLVTGALLNWITLATGVLGHEGSALLVIGNSMRLLRR